MSQTTKTKHSLSDLRKAPRPEAIARSLEIFNDSWSFSVLQEIFFGVRKFDEFQNNLKISRSVLTRRLRHLEEQKIIDRIMYSERPKRYEYKLTERGKDMYSIFVLLRQWGEKWLDNVNASDLELTHQNCGHSLEASLCCNACGDVIIAHEVLYTINNK